MQSRLVAISSPWPLSVGLGRVRTLVNAVISSIPRTADPAIHSEDPTDEDTVQVAKVAAAEKAPRRTATIEEEYKPIPPQPATPLASTAKLEKTEVGPRVDPSFQQKRYICGGQGREIVAKWSIEEVSCVGVDGADGVEEDDDFKEYYKDHRPSPISEIEVADTRFPITRATTTAAYDDDTNSDVVGWKPEQLDTAEEALRRAEAIFRERAETGIPDWPHSRVLAARLSGHKSD